MKRFFVAVIPALLLLFSCELYDETAATVNFWDFKNAVVKDWKNDPDSFRSVDFSDTKLVSALVKQYGTASRFAMLSDKEKKPEQLLVGSPENDYFGCRYFYKEYTKDKPLKSVLGLWIGSVLYTVYSATNPVIGLVAPGMGIDTVFCAFWAEAERENKSSPGKIVVKIDMDGGSKIILDGYSYFYPRMKEGAEIQYVNAANLEGMYMTGFDVAFSPQAASEEKKGESK